MTDLFGFSAQLPALGLPPSEPSEPDTHERRLMALFATGMTDEDVAAKLGWSRRTLQRRLQAAMDKLEARSRIQAGYRLARSGWLEETGSLEGAHLRHQPKQAFPEATAKNISDHSSGGQD